MASIRDLRTRIGTITQTRKITSAMKMVSAAKLSRAQAAINAARPYAEHLTGVLNSVAQGVDPDAHPLLAPRDEVKNVDIVVFVSDRGLCGAFNANVLKRADALRKQRHGLGINTLAVGKRSVDHCRRHGFEMSHRWTGIVRPEPVHAREIAQVVMQRYLAGESDEVHLVFGRFKSALTQEPTAEKLLPFEPAESDGPPAQYTVEPAPEALLGLLVPRAVEFAIFRAMLETAASEHGARMTAMDSATNNTQELIRTLTLDMNKARQAAITGELIEIVSGAEAL